MRRVFLLRHAKSSWEDRGLADHDRPLAPRGRRATMLLREHLRRESVAPAVVLCSPTRRTRETLEGIGPALAQEVPVRIERELYAASAERLLARLRALDDEVDSVLVIGHNPGLELLALSLGGAGESLAAVRRKYPTGALATLEFAGSWSELAPGSAELTDFVTPKQLAKP
jgi:phosphohistidine phosphatase